MAGIDRKDVVNSVTAKDNASHLVSKSCIQCCFALQGFKWKVASRQGVKTRASLQCCVCAYSHTCWQGVPLKAGIQGVIQMCGKKAEWASGR
eukprot:1160317-Pelagomonas_calceolata.AAC.2